MLCNKCNINEATFYMEQNINGKITKLALCPACANEYKGIGFNPYSTFNLLGGLFQPASYSKRQNNEVKKCTLCASTFSDISKSGKVGCAECYKVFKDELNPTVKRIHGDVRHIGRKPYVEKSQSNDVDCDGVSLETNNNLTENNVSVLKEQLNQAIEREDYETAAVLRDKIRELSE